MMQFALILSCLLAYTQALVIYPNDPLLKQVDHAAEPKMCATNADCGSTQCCKQALLLSKRDILPQGGTNPWQAHGTCIAMVKLMEGQQCGGANFCSCADGLTCKMASNLGAEFVPHHHCTK